MFSTQRAARIFFYSAWAVIMTGLTYILGAVSLKALRRKFGRIGYWGISTALSAVFFALSLKMFAIAFFSLVVLIGVFSELEEMGFSLKISAFFALTINALLSSGAMVFWIYSTGPKWSQQVLATLEAMLKPLAEINPHIQIKHYELMLVIPSVVLILWIAAIYLAILLESKLVSEDVATTTTAADQPKLSMRRQLVELKMPDAIVWIFTASLLGTFGGFGNQYVEAVAANVLNVCTMLFFLQGIAVVAKFFEKLRISAFWQTLLMVLVVLYLFLFVSLIGLTDYWLDYRSRMAKRTEEFNRELE